MNHSCSNWLISRNQSQKSKLQSFGSGVRPWSGNSGPVFLDQRSKFYFRCSKKVSDSAEATRESRRESHSRFINTSRATQQSVIGKKASVLSVNGADSAEGSVAKSESEDERMNLTPCIPEDKWLGPLTIGLVPPTKEKEGVPAMLMHIFDWVSLYFQS